MAKDDGQPHSAIDAETTTVSIMLSVSSFENGGMPGMA